MSSRCESTPLPPPRTRMYEPTQRCSWPRTACRTVRRRARAPRKPGRGRGEGGNGCTQHKIARGASAKKSRRRQSQTSVTASSLCARSFAPVHRRQRAPLSSPSPPRARAKHTPDESRAPWPSPPTLHGVRLDAAAAARQLCQGHVLAPRVFVQLGLVPGVWANPNVFWGKAESCSDPGKRFRGSKTKQGASILVAS